MKRLPKERRPLIDPKLDALMAEARRELDQSTRDFARFACGREDPLELNGFRGPRQHRNERGSE
jgi:hypothetical protein